MDEVNRAVDTAKALLRRRGLTYRDVARALRLSEASVKRVFAHRTFTAKRLAQVADLLGYTLAELLAESATEVPPLRTLTLDQERRLVSNTRLLLVAVCALNRWTLSDIVATYALARHECVRHLVALDRMGLIAFLPGDRIRPRVARDFDWLPDGPIRQHFMGAPLQDFLASDFADGDESLDFAQGMFTESALAQLHVELRRLRARMATLHEESLAAPLAQRAGTGLVLALRRWEPEAFRALRRRPAEGARQRGSPARS